MKEERQLSETAKQFHVLVTKTLMLKVFPSKKLKGLRKV